MSAAPWQALDRGHPQQALRHWRAELLREHSTIERHLHAAALGLPADPLAGLRRQALALLTALQRAEPGEPEQQQLGSLLRGWGELCLSHAPGRALEHLERAWACGPDAALERTLSNLYARQGMASGALALAPPQVELPPWPTIACAGLHCAPCQQATAEAARAPEEPALQILELAGGEAWIEWNPHLQETHGVAVADREGRLLADACRRYPSQWPVCRHRAARTHDSLSQLGAGRPGAQPLQVNGPVLAVTDLSAELYYHGQLEWLPRLGRAWQALHPQLPELRLWHNAGTAPWVQQALQHLGVPANRVIHARRHPRLRASQLLVPTRPSEFGVPGEPSLAWLRRFWLAAIAEPEPDTEAPTRIVLSRPLSQRRPLLQHQAWNTSLAAQGFAALQPGLGVREQLRSLRRGERVVAAHGGAMVNLLLLPQGAEVLELANPAYAPPYFTSLIRSGGLRHRRVCGAATPAVLQQLLYAGPLEWPIDCPPP